MERWKAVDMARKRRAPHYTGAVAEPIYPGDHYKRAGRLGDPTLELDLAAITKEQVEKDAATVRTLQD